MQVMIGTIEADVSEDGHDVSLPPPGLVQNALVLSSLQESHATKPSSVVEQAQAVGAPDQASLASSLSIGLDGRLGTSLILCAVVAGVAVKRFAANRRSRTASSRSTELVMTLDEAAFLRRYASGAR